MNTPLPPLDTDSLRAAAARLPALPAVVVELVTSLDAEDVDADTLAEIISRDQILVARLLRLANSSFYGMLGRIHSIRDAIMLIGLRGVRSLAIAASLSGALPRECTGLSLQHFWRHSTATAIAAQELARRNRLPADLAFIAGLLHDIGRLILANAIRSTARPCSNAWPKCPASVTRRSGRSSASIMRISAASSPIIGVFPPPSSRQSEAITMRMPSARICWRPACIWPNCSPQ